MKSADGNPPANALGGGVTEAELTEAINKSGYPLQSVVVDRVLAGLSEGDVNCTVQEEWPFEDRDSGQVRQLDALVDCQVAVGEAYAAPERPRRAQDYIRTYLDLLIECKQSELPFVFFIRQSPTGEVPTIAGLSIRELSLKEADDDDLAVGMSAYDALGIWDLDFAKHPITAISMTRVQRKGHSLELSGEDAFRGLALPLLKAVDYFVQESEPDRHRLYQDLRMVVPLVVLRAPIVAVRMKQEKAVMEAVPWVRVLRTEPGSDSRFQLSHSKSFDVVHVDHLKSYISMVLDAATEFSVRVRDFAMQLLTGEALWGFETEEGDEAVEPLPFRQLKAPLSDSQFDKLMSMRWREVHGQIEGLPQSQGG